METAVHTLNNLFAQLGLPSDAAGIDRFVKTHRPLPSTQALHEATFWSPAQAAFLREEVLVDADWAGIVDRLDAELRAPAHQD